jgi:hypothetical protein
LSDSEVAALAAAAGYESWAMTNLSGISAAFAAPTADPDGDGQSNRIEYALDTDPLIPDGSPFTILRTGDGSLWLNYPRRLGISGLRYTVWKSDDLVTWAPVTTGYLEEMTQPVPGKSLEIVTGRIVNVTGSAFFRLGVEAIGP